VHQGPVYSEYKLAPHRFCADGALSTTIRIYKGLRRIDIRTRIENNEKFVRYQVMFPTTIKDGKVVHEIPFGSIERPNGIDFLHRTGQITVMDRKDLQFLTGASRAT